MYNSVQYVSDRFSVSRVDFSLNSYCVLSCFFAGMSCSISSSYCWKMQKEALTISHAATIPSVYSECLTTACSLKSGLRLQRPSFSPVTSVSGLILLNSILAVWCPGPGCFLRAYRVLLLLIYYPHLHFLCFKGAKIHTKRIQYGCEHTQIKAESWHL